MTFRPAAGRIVAILARFRSFGRWHSSASWDWTLIASRISAAVLTVAVSVLALTVVFVAVNI